MTDTVPVLDASILIKVLTPEPGSEAAHKLLGGIFEAFPSGPTIPDLAYPECANVLWKKVRRGELSPETAHACLQDLMDLPVQTARSEEVVVNALTLALEAGISAYDALYVALAMRRDAPFWTADIRLAQALRDFTVDIHVLDCANHKK